METDEMIAEHLKVFHCGEGAAVTSRELENTFHIRGPDLRRAVNRLRAKGVPICSFDGGYYYASNEAELRHTLNQLQSRIRKITRAERGLAKALGKFADGGQLTLLPKEGELP